MNKTTFFSFLTLTLVGISSFGGFAAAQYDDAFVETAPTANQYGFSEDVDNMYFPSLTAEGILAHKKDPSINLILEYYQALEDHNFAKADSLRVTKKGIAHLKKTYNNVESIVVYDIKRAGKNLYTFYVDITENGKISTIAVARSIKGGKLLGAFTKPTVQKFPKEFSFVGQEKYYFRANKDAQGNKIYRAIPKEGVAHAVFLIGEEQIGTFIRILPAKLASTLSPEDGSQILLKTKKTIVTLERCSTGAGENLACTRTHDRISTAKFKSK